jgi:hypothetical protein
MRNRMLGFEGREATIQFLIEKTKEQLTTDSSNITMIAAEPGMGKSTILSGLISQLQREKDKNLVVIYHFVGCSNLSSFVEKYVLSAIFS